MPSNKNTNHFTFLFAHGAGADKDSDWMLAMDKLLTVNGVEVIRFNFPYMNKRLEDGKRRPPDRMPKLLEAFKLEVEKISENKKLIIGGKSMGGRVASHLVCEPEFAYRVAAVVCFGFPFHPPGKPEKYRGEHLQTIQTPTLILQGERDTFGSREEVVEFDLSEKVSTEFLFDGDHSFKPRVKSGTTLDKNLQLATEKVITFCKKLK
ncbi:alpha/beta family hydrolase [Aliikangiella coralliicola]|uniref:Alpha/beta hydrolase n=1 Tax=Aliikangiella coralliicola TaxID=2592383 RepID=A0A545U0D7_9GAMM|nr:alpha/beta family hydrolase [Aliikangiella coralliicola]TQV82930.1 alpha/beta hydrolase [Aliikangiella coralliicola]